MRPPDAGNIRADDTDRAGRQLAQDAPHPVAKIAAALRHARQMRGPDPALQPGTVGRHGQHHLPARILDAAQKGGDLVAKPPGGRHHPDLAPQPRLDPPRSRLLEHNDQPAADHRCRSMSRWGMPASI